MDEVKAPKAWPEGTYYGSIIKYELGESKKKQTPQVVFECNIHAFGEDIPAEAQTDIDLSRRTLSSTFYFTPDSEYRLVQFLQSCGINTSGNTFDTTLPQTMGAAVMLSVIHRMDERDPKAPPYLAVDRIVGHQA